VERDGFADEDKMSLHLINLLKDRLGGQHAMNVEPRFNEYEGARVLVVECSRSQSPVFVKDGTFEKFFVRYGPSTQELVGERCRNISSNDFEALNTLIYEAMCSNRQCDFSDPRLSICTDRRHGEQS